MYLSCFFIGCSLSVYGGCRFCGWCVCVCWLSLWWVYVCWVFLCLGFVFLLYVWVPRFFVVLGFVFLVRFLGCLGVLVGDFFVFWRLSGVLFCGGGCFWGGFFYLVDGVLLAFVFLGAGFLCGWVLRFLCCVGRAVFVSVWLGVSVSLVCFRVSVCLVW